MKFDFKYMPRILHCIICMMMFNLNSNAFAQTASCEKPWPAWESFKKSSITDDGKVEDHSTDNLRTTSEGQSYALFFSLAAGDRATFDKILNWSEKNLAGDDLITHLPSWLLGKKQDDSVGVLDENSASDADLWVAYTLGEAGRLWDNRRYVALSSLLANRILTKETQEVPGLGLVLLPGSKGFTPTPASVRLNPSYVPMQLLRWFVTHSTDPRWAELLKSSQQLIVKSSAQGYAPDWIIYDYDRGFLPDSEKGSIGSYDAIRVYLWAGMMNPADSNRSLLLDSLKPMAKLLEKRGTPPEFINTLTGLANNDGPGGFSAAMIPFLQASGQEKAASAQRSRIAAHPIAENSYYDQVLSLFALGWDSNNYHFDSNGNLSPRWMTTCP